MPKSRRRCLIVDGHPVIRTGLGHMLGSKFEIEEAANGVEARDTLASLGGFEVAIVGMCRQNTNGAAPSTGRGTIEELRRGHPGLGIVALAERPDRLVAAEAVRAGANAFVARTAGAEELRGAVEAAVSGERFVAPEAGGGKRPRGLTRRQRQILQLIADGESTAQAAQQLDVSEETVRTHTKQLLARIGARNRAHAVAMGLRDSLID